ncbi:hemin uptake protein HemP [Pseudoluteimonas lycopersici]|uniref:Hemin uptake protein HemP n=2 Tax=Pseudoluteimonas lycopersici TaxID=1324796 RepID=A0A516V4Y1_9GAMM|nr:hemin uptake protein HemP [Lysobacter lycopersici]
MHAHAVPAELLPVSAISTRAPARHAPQTVEIDSARLLDGQREVVIRHGDECYRLRHTRNDKLILTK